MAISRTRKTGAMARSTSSQSDYDEVQDNVTSAHAFFRGELRWLWPIWVLFFLMVAVIVWDRFV